MVSHDVTNFSNIAMVWILTWNGVHINTSDTVVIRFDLFMAHFCHLEPLYHCVKKNFMRLVWKLTKGGKKDKMSHSVLSWIQIKSENIVP